ncbi:CLUMA_CG010106, isoform A [Clunio marinus]|uniref:CLUMA_CG010106, isoform A n=1 Tax=Clunio marinus TaxID=568069 RepID=A0A1J1I9B3_9DIPT|nr:CLUMA_CG010106, isoform A [Clunio marinus]
MIPRLEPNDITLYKPAFGIRYQYKHSSILRERCKKKKNIKKNINKHETNLRLKEQRVLFMKQENELMFLSSVYQLRKPQKKQFNGMEKRSRNEF